MESSSPYTPPLTSNRLLQQPAKPLCNDPAKTPQYPAKNLQYQALSTRKKQRK